MKVMWLAAVLAGVTSSTVAAQQSPTTLAEVYGQVRAQNPRLAAAAALVAARSAMESAAGLPPDPAIEVGVMNFSLPDLDTDMPTSMAPSIQAMQMLPLGKLGLSGAIAEQATRMAAADAEEAWWEVRSQAAMSFYEIWQTDRQLAAMRETLQWLQQFASVARAMYSAGEGQQADVLRAGVEVARMEAELARMAAMRTAAAGKLNALLNRPADTPIGALTYDAQSLALPGPDTLRAWAEQTRPMLERGRTGMEQARTRLKLARRELWPDLTLGFQYGQRRTPPDAMGMGGEIERMGSVMVGFTLPVFAKQRQLKMREEAQAMERMAAADLGLMRATVDARITELVAELERARTLVELYGTQVLPQARATVESSFSSYRVGQADFMTLVDAQMSTNQYEQELATLLAAYGAAAAELEMTIGRELPRTGELLAEAR
jgi:outer membrane protein TolC